MAQSNLAAATPPAPGAAKAPRQAATALKLAAGKIGAFLFTVFVSSVIVFFSRWLVPGDPINFLLRGRSPNPEAIAEVTAIYGLDRPPLEQYWNWITGVVQGDFGRSLQYRQDVTEVILGRLPVTLGLVVMAGVMIAILGLAAGIAASLLRGTFADRAIVASMSGLAAIPSFVGAIVLIAIFAVQLGLFPSFGSGNGFADMLYHLVLPSLALALSFIAVVGRVTRSAMVEQFAREHVEVARSRGITPVAVVIRHVLRNATGPILTVSGLLVAGLLVSSAIVEQAFGLAGLGSLLVSSVDRLDFPVVQAIVLIVVTAFVAINTLVDLLGPVIDPRLKAGEGAR
ncbi:ABC transporter permease [Paeniglutamicibacter terrestris]|uniref:ABC transporter permease n=1 Tax=Paeniglutamicibacter terrestris TaxID=2723403 RepID=A0ABX1G128_9MICC|nr:ABC transporter permease [Paeniglutamicibacter terrestris]NKG19947.1 ABC transporter permease [Paeniglutamicibacter terrestris]